MVSYQGLEQHDIGQSTEREPIHLFVGAAGTVGVGAMALLGGWWIILIDLGMYAGNLHLNPCLLLFQNPCPSTPAIGVTGKYGSR